MKKIGLWAATLLAVSMLASPSAIAGSPMGVCQAGGYNTVVLG